MPSRLLGLALAVAACLLLYLALGRPGRDLFPPPDGPEYFAGAVNLAAHGDYAIHLAGTLQPPRYPPGFSILMRPFLPLGSEPLAAPFLANATAAFAVLLLLFAHLWRRGQHVAAGLAPLLLVTTPAFVILARSPMAETTSMLFVTAAALALVGYLRTQRLAAVLAAELLAGRRWPAVVTAELLPPHLLGDPWLVAPATDDHDYRHNPAAFAYGPEQRQAQVVAAMHEGRPIYAVAVDDLEALLAQLPKPAGHVWQALHRQKQAGVARLVRRQGPRAGPLPLRSDADATLPELSPRGLRQRHRDVLGVPGAVDAQHQQVGRVFALARIRGIGADCVTSPFERADDPIARRLVTDAGDRGKAGLAVALQQHTEAVDLALGREHGGMFLHGCRHQPADQRRRQDVPRQWRTRA